VLLGGVPGVAAGQGRHPRAHARRHQRGERFVWLGAKVTILDLSLELCVLSVDVMPANCVMIYRTATTFSSRSRSADLVVGGVLIPGARARSSSARKT